MESRTLSVVAACFVAATAVACDAASDILPVDGGPESTAPPPPTDDEGGIADAGSEFTGRSGDGGPCHPAFASGLNVAWYNFGADIPHPNLSFFDQVFQNTYQAGGRVARWWFHVNGTTTPLYDANGMAVPITEAEIEDVRSIIDTARNEGVMLVISLWSFDMLKGGLPPAIATGNMNLLSVDENRQAYITNVLTPLVTALAGYPGLYAWETFNEPEGMASGGSGWRAFTGSSGQTVPMPVIQKTVNWFAAAIHAADPTALVTNGTWEFQAVSNAAGMNNYYADAVLADAGGIATGGNLDFYEVHYYAADTAKFSPFVNPVSHWGLDKPVVIGEFYALPQDNVADAGDLYTTLYNGGYAGAWAWQYFSSDGSNSSNQGQTTTWPSMQVPLENLQAAAPNAISCP